MSTNKTYYITTPIYYPSDKLHIGHAYTTTSCDAMARYKRLRGYDVMFLTGTDEHGQKIQERAEKAGLAPLPFVDRIVAGVRELWQKLDISYDDFIRTTEDRHTTVVQKIFQQLLDQDDIYLAEYTGLYCTPCESFWTETQVKNAGGNCPDCGRPVTPMTEKSYFFRMSKYADRLIQYYEEHPEFIEPESRKTEMLNNFLKPGLQDLAVSRTTFEWGIKVASDPKHVIYVWLDALTNYITAIGYGSDDQAQREKFAKYWPADVHVIGKDIVRFHTIYWPIFLMALGLPLPKKVFGHGFFMSGGDKMSKSKGNVIDPVPLIDRYGLDALRYYLLREVPFGADGVFTPDNFVDRINHDLANDLGNLLNRTTAMMEKYFEGVVQPYVEGATEFDAGLIALAKETVDKVEAAMEKMEFSVALSALWTFIGRSNKYIDETQPWTLAKNESDRAKLGSVMYVLMESQRITSILLQPFMTQTPQKMWAALGVSEDAALTAWDSARTFGALPAGTIIRKAEPMFPRLDVAVETAHIADALGGGAAAAEAAAPEAGAAEAKPAAAEAPAQPAKAEIGIDDFGKVELRVAQVLSAEPVKGADKLLKLQLDMGSEQRQVVSGIAQYYKPEELVGRKVICVANLKPVKLRGEMSQGMILAASEGGQLTIATVPDSMPNGAIVK